VDYERGMERNTSKHQLENPARKAHFGKLYTSSRRMILGSFLGNSYVTMTVATSNYTEGFHGMPRSSQVVGRI
jgi:hypothetical protein